MHEILARLESAEPLGHMSTQELEKLGVEIRDVLCNLLVDLEAVTPSQIAPESQVRLGESQVSAAGMVLYQVRFAREKARAVPGPVQKTDRFHQMLKKTYRMPKRTSPIPKRTSPIPKPIHRMLETTIRFSRRTHRIWKPIDPIWKRIHRTATTTHRIPESIH